MDRLRERHSFLSLSLSLCRFIFSLTELFLLFLSLVARTYFVLLFLSPTPDFQSLFRPFLPGDPDPEPLSLSVLLQSELLYFSFDCLLALLLFVVSSSLMMGFRDFIPDVSNGISIPAIFANVWFLSDTDDFGMPFRFLASFRNIISFSRDVLSVFCLEIFGCHNS